MIFTQDMKDLIELLEKYQVQYVLVGGVAVIHYGYARTTQDIDILIFPSPKNAQNMIMALEEFGFGKAGVPSEYFEAEGTAIHLGVEPNRIDLLTNLQGISNEEIFERKKRISYHDISLNIIALEDLLECKRRSNRPKDHADVDELEKINKKKQKKE